MSDLVEIDVGLAANSGKPDPGAPDVLLRTVAVSDDRFELAPVLTRRCDGAAFGFAHIDQSPAVP